MYKLHNKVVHTVETGTKLCNWLVPWGIAMYCGRV